MDKNEFLAELRKGLAILEDGEQNDILEEYSQHIGMKISNGLSEEEAIGDFGNVKELAAQILEAYHVNPQYRKKRQDNVAEEGKKFLNSTKEKLQKAGIFIKNLCKSGFYKVKAGCRWLWIHLKSSLASLKNMLSAKKVKSDTAGIPKEEKMDSNTSYTYKAAKNGSLGFFHSASSLAARGCRKLWHGFLWCIRLAWNLAIILVATLNGLLSLGLLFSLAVLLVWLTQGYPLIGLTLVCFGGVICSGAVTLLTATLVLRKNKDKKIYKVQ